MSSPEVDIQNDPTLEEISKTTLTNWLLEKGLIQFLTAYYNHVGTKRLSDADASFGVYQEKLTLDELAILNLMIEKLQKTLTIMDLQIAIVGSELVTDDDRKRKLNTKETYSSLLNKIPTLFSNVSGS